MAEITIYTTEPEEWEQLTQDLPSYKIIDLSTFILGVVEE
jgi:hypothetical protein